MSDRERQQDEIEALESIYDKDLIISSTWPSSGCLRISPTPIEDELKMIVVSVVNQKSIEKTIKLRYLAPVELYFKCPKDYPSISQPFFMVKCIWLSEQLLADICQQLDSIWDRTRSEILFDWAYFLKECCSFLKIHELKFTSNMDEAIVTSASELQHGMSESADLRLKELRNELPKINCQRNSNVCDGGIRKKKVRRSRERRCPNTFKYETPKQVVPDKQNLPIKKDDPVESSSPAPSTYPSATCPIFQYIITNMPMYGVRRKTLPNNCDSRVIPNCQESGTRTRTLVHEKMVDYNEECFKKIFRSESHFCNICFDEKQGSMSSRMQECGHVFCRDCISEYLTVNIKNGNSRSLCCPQVDCETAFSVAQIRQHVDDATFKKFEEFAQKAAVEDNPNLLYCPRNVCQSVARRCPELGLELCYCSRCSFYFCLYCKKAYHGVQACQLQDEERMKVIQEYLKASPARQVELERRYTKPQMRKWVDEYLTTKWMEKSSKPCPNCKVPIQKNAGCNKMLCFKCNIPFCWICDKCLSRQRPYDHFSNPESPCYQKLFPFEETEEWSDFEDELDENFEEDLYIL